MPPLRKRDPSGEKQMMQIDMKPFPERPAETSRPSTMNSTYEPGEYRHSARSLHTSQSYSRPYTEEYPGYSSSTLNVDTGYHPHSPENMSGSLPPFARHAYTDSQPNTRSSSPYPTPQTPFGFRSTETLRPLVPDNSSTFLKRDWVREGQIAQLHSRDDKEFLTGWKRKLYNLSPFLAILTLILYVIYFGMRITFVVYAQTKFHAPFPLAWVFIAIELIVSVPIFVNTFVSHISLPFI